MKLPFARQESEMDLCGEDEEVSINLVLVICKRENLCAEVPRWSQEMALEFEVMVDDV